MNPSALPNLQSLRDAILKGERRAMARAITLTESLRAEDQELSRKLQQLLLPHAGSAIKIGISGIPGVGKSTLIENLGLKLLKDDPTRKIAVLAVDPSSPVRGGSLLGDKTRMEQLSQHPATFIRPSPGGSHSGGVTQSCRESMIILDAAGYGTILVETIGAGQAEHMVASMVDLFILLHMPATGDELQGMKKGTLELAEIIVINKADGDLKAPARQAKEELQRAMQLQSRQTWNVPVLLMSDRESPEDCLNRLAESVEGFISAQKSSGRFEKKRQHQLSDWFLQEIHHQLTLSLSKQRGYHSRFQNIREQIFKGKITPGTAAYNLVQEFFNF